MIFLSRKIGYGTDSIFFYSILFGSNSFQLGGIRLTQTLDRYSAAYGGGALLS
jgi:hypothetical protein